jgi:hypothetical protein
MTWTRYLVEAAEVSLCDANLGIRALLSYFDPRLVNIWADLRAFTAAANEVNSSDGRPSQKYGHVHYQEIMISLQYRLLMLEGAFGHDNAPEEAVRLALVVFTASIFFQFRGGRIGVDAPSRKLDAALARLPSGAGSYAAASPMLRLTLWMYFLGAILFGDIRKEPDYLRRLWATTRAAGLATWPDVRAVLASLLWVGPMHDILGMRVYKLASQEDAVSNQLVASQPLDGACLPPPPPI